MIERLILLKDIIPILLEHTELRGIEPLSNRKPSHGSCCSCQECGHYYDDCVCEHNEILEKLSKLKEY